MSIDIEKYLDNEEVFHLLDKLVSAPTVNPPGDEHLGFSAMEPELHRLGLQVEKYISPQGRINFIVWWPEERDDQKTFIFNGHMDVVPVGSLRQWNFDPFRATRSDGKIYGRGTADMKGSIAAIIEASALLDRAGFKPDHGCVAMHFVSDEEVLGSQGTAYLLASGKVRGDLAVVGEPTTGEILVAARGVLWTAVEVLGRAAHGSVPHLGINAIEKMYDYLRELRPPDRALYHPLLGRPTRNIGTIRGGEKVNVVAPTCRVEIDRRMLPQEPIEHAKADFLEALESLQRRDPDFKATIDFFCIAEPSEIPVDSEIVYIAQRATEAVRGRKTAVTGFPGASDARFLINQRKIPTIIYGVGDLAQAHTIDEHIQETDLQEMSLIYAEMIRLSLS